MKDTSTEGYTEVFAWGSNSLTFASIAISIDLSI